MKICSQKVLTHSKNEVYLSSLIETANTSQEAPIEAISLDWVISSAGRASPLQGEGRGFEPLITHQIERLTQSLIKGFSFKVVQVEPR